MDLFAHLWMYLILFVINIIYLKKLLRKLQAAFFNDWEFSEKVCSFQNVCFSTWPCTNAFYKMVLLFYMLFGGGERVMPRGMVGGRVISYIYTKETLDMTWKK